MNYVVYILQSLKDGRYYIGHTADMEKRLRAHNSGKVKSTQKRKPLKLVYREEYETKGEAFRREMYLKSAKGYQEKKKIVDEIDSGEGIV